MAVAHGLWFPFQVKTRWPPSVVANARLLGLPSVRLLLSLLTGAARLALFLLLLRVFTGVFWCVGAHNGGEKGCRGARRSWPDAARVPARGSARPCIASVPWLIK